MALGHKQEIVVKLAARPNGVGHDEVVRLYGKNDTLAMTTVQSLTGQGLIRHIPKSAYPRRYEVTEKVHVVVKDE